MSDEKRSKAGRTAGIIACVLAVIGMIFFAIVFVPLAAIVAIVGTINAIRTRNISAIGVNVLAWVLIVVGFVTSPTLMLMVLARM